VALYGLLDRFKCSVSVFRLQYDCNDPVIEDVLCSLEEELKRARQMLDIHPPGMEYDRDKFDVEEATAPEQLSSLYVNVPQNSYGATSTDDLAKNSVSTSDGSEGDIVGSSLICVQGDTEPQQFPKVELSHEMQPSDRLNTRQAAKLVGMPLERFKQLEDSGTTPYAFRSKDGCQYYSDDLLRWKKSKGDTWPLLVRGSQPLPVFGGDNGFEKKAS
jgi:hypothetical protein